MSKGSYLGGSTVIRTARQVRSPNKTRDAMDEIAQKISNDAYAVSAQRENKIHEMVELKKKSQASKRKARRK